MNIGLALEAGLCISLIAILLDKMSLAWANKQVDYFENLTFFQRYKLLIIFGTSILIFSIIAFIANGYFDKINYLYVIPIEKGFTFAHYIDAAVDWVWETFFYSLNSFNKFLLTEVLGPMKKAYLGMPVVATLTLTMGVAYIIGGIRTSLLVGGMMLFIAMSKYWDRALITMYLSLIHI